MINLLPTLLSHSLVVWTLNHQPLQKDLCALLGTRRMQKKCKTQASSKGHVRYGY